MEQRFSHVAGIVELSSVVLLLLLPFPGSCFSLLDRWTTDGMGSWYGMHVGWWAYVGAVREYGKEVSKSFKLKHIIEFRMQHGFASRNGILATFLAREDYSGIERVLERFYFGFLITFSPSSKLLSICDATSPFATLGRERKV